MIFLMEHISCSDDFLACFQFHMRFFDGVTYDKKLLKLFQRENNKLLHALIHFDKIFQIIKISKKYFSI